MFSKKLKDLASKVKNELSDVEGLKGKAAGLKNLHFGSIDDMVGSLKGLPEPDYDEHNQAISIDFISLMRGMHIKPETGIFSIGGKGTEGFISVYFLPTKDKEGKELAYEPSSTNPDRFLLRAHLVRVDKSEEELCATFTLATSKVLFPASKVYVTGGSGASDNFTMNADLRDGGDYQLRFYHLTKHFYTHDFSVRKTKASDAFSTIQEMYTMTGSWEMDGLLQVRHDDVSESYEMRFQPIISYSHLKAWSDKQAIDPRASCRRKLTLLRDGVIIGTDCLEENDNGDLFAEKEIPAFLDYSLQVGKLLSQHGDARFLKVPKVIEGTELWVKNNELKSGRYEIVMEVTHLKDRPDFTACYQFELSDGVFQVIDTDSEKEYPFPRNGGKDFIILKHTIKNQ